MEKVMASINPVGSARASDGRPQLSKMLEIAQENAQRAKTGEPLLDPTTGEPVKPVVKNPYAAENSDAGGALRMLKKGEMMERLENFKDIRKRAEAADRACLSEEALAKRGIPRTP